MTFLQNWLEEEREFENRETGLEKELLNDVGYFFDFLYKSVG